jgi:hypothetical protein
MTITDDAVRRVQEWVANERKAGRLIIQFSDECVREFLLAAIDRERARGDACARGNP